MKSKQQQSYQIKEIAEFNPENIGKDFQFSEIYYIDTSSVTEGKLTDIQRLEKKDAPSRAKRLVKKNDILISTVRPNLKHYYFVKNPQENLVVSTGFVVIRPINVNPLYLYYYLITPSFIEYLSGVADSHTSAYPSFPPEIIEETEIDLPDNSVQEQIGKTLDDLDTKIQNLQNQNKILEQTAQTIFKSWFVDFDGQTEFEDSKIGQIPKGWKIKKLADICTTQYGYTESASDEEIGPKFLRVTDMNKQAWINWDDVPYCKITEDDFEKHSLKQGDVVVSRMADPGKAGIMEEETKAVFASYLVRLKTSSIIQSYFIFYFLRSTKYLDYAYGASGSGSTRQNMNAKVITGVDLVIPPDETTKSFFKLIYPIRINIVNNLHQINHLTKTRDALLPKLMSGEIRV